MLEDITNRHGISGGAYAASEQDSLNTSFRPEERLSSAPEGSASIHPQPEKINISPKEIFRENVKGLDIKIERGISGDTLILAAGGNALLAVSAFDLANGTEYKSTKFEELKKGVVVANHNVSVDLSYGALNVVVDLHPLRLPGTFSDTFRLAAAWLSFFFMAPAVGVTHTRRLVFTENHFTEVQPGGGGIFTGHPEKTFLPPLQLGPNQSPD